MKKILLTGDSLIEFFDWQSRCPQFDIANEGIAGETVRGLLYGLPFLKARMEVPAAVVLMIGTN
ncbi:MAG: GDSL family lipase, partial [Desulfobulbaceae bacterium]|nr:GDSL family lipase [Desulfobulbaceae bacterium]